MSRYTDESAKLFIGKAFSPREFAEWWSAQTFGTLPYNAVGIHHTAIPNRDQFQGLQHIHNIFAWYARPKPEGCGWPWGRGPHLWLCDGRGSHPNSPKTPTIYVGTHPAHDGIGISYRNHRWLHIEAIDFYDDYGLTPEMEELWRFTLKIVCEQRSMPIRQMPTPHDGPASPIGCCFHRLAGTDVKSCPGEQLTPKAFFAAMNRDRGGPVQASAKKYYFLYGGALDERVADSAAEALSKNGLDSSRVGSFGMPSKPGRDGESDIRWISENALDKPLGTYPSAFVGTRVLRYVPERVKEAIPRGGDLFDCAGKSYRDTQDRVERVVAEFAKREGKDQRKLISDYREILGQKLKEPTGPDEPGPLTRNPDAIAGVAIFSEEEVLSWARTKGAAPPALKMIPAIYKYAPQRNLGADFLSIQMCHETAFGRYGGASRAYNPAGIKKAGPRGDAPGDFEVPHTADEGARMLVNHWCAVLQLGPIRSPHARYKEARAVYAARPKISKITQLGNGNWATDPLYAAKLIAHLNELADTLGGKGKVTSGGSEAAVEKAISFGMAVRGTPYGPGWKAGTWPKGPPLYSEFAPKKWTADYVRGQTVICSGLMNLMRQHAANLPVPGVKENDGWPGGTAAYWRVFVRGKKSQPFNPAKLYPRGWLLGSPFLGDPLALQGHVGVSLGDGRVLEAYPGGVSCHRTAAEVHAVLLANAGTGWTYAVPPEIWLRG